MVVSLHADDDVSIHAPPNRKERPPNPNAPKPRAISFNPRPSQPEGATFIRSHATISERLFQSTPLPTGRSDYR